MTIFIIIYIIGYITNVLLLIYNEPEYVTLGDLTKFLLISIISWIAVISILIGILISNWDEVIIKKRK